MPSPSDSRDDAPLVSIAICSYNNWPGLELAIQSALCQSYRNVEVIVVDNTSSDGTAAAVARQFGGRVRWHQQPNARDAGAYNTGVRLARGEFVQVMDGDDVLAPNKIELQMNVFRAHPDADIVYGNVRQFNERAGRAYLRDTDAQRVPDLMATFLEKMGDFFGNTLNALIRRSVFDRVGPWDDQIYVTDVDYWMRCLEAGIRFEACGDRLMGFIAVGPDKMSTRQTLQMDGQERHWIKALGSVHAEPYHAMIRQNLARVRITRALRDASLSRRAALEKLGQARAECPDVVSAATYAVAAAVLMTPGGTSLVRSERLRTVRRGLMRVLGFRPAD